MNVDESEYIGRPIDKVPSQDPTDEVCMGRKTRKRDGEVVRDDDGIALFGGYCQAWPGKGTDHVGAGRCKFHAGSSPTGEDNPAFEHGLFSDYLSEDDRRTAQALTEYDDAEKESFFDKFDRMVREARKNGDPGLSAKQIKELGRSLNQHNRAAQQEIDLVRKLIKAHNKIFEGEDVNVNPGDRWRQLMGGDG